MPSVLPLLLLLLILPAQVFADACIIHSHSDKVDVTVCQQNVNVPESLFHDGFCQPHLQDQKIDVKYVEICPSGAFGVCHGAKSPGTPYSQDIHYYGVATDTIFLRPSCEQQSHGTWSGP